MKSRLRPKFSLIVFEPYVCMIDPFAATRVILQSFLYLPKIVFGMTEISAPVSIKNFKLFSVSLTNKRRVLKILSSVAEMIGFISLLGLKLVVPYLFYMYMDLYICVHFLQNGNDTNKMHLFR